MEVKWLYYKIINKKKKEWILLLHSICSNMHIFDDYITKLSSKYNILLIDLPGHGKSNLDKVSNLQDVVNDIVEILDNNDIDKVDIWGVSLGAIVANEIEYMYPNRVNLLLLEGAAFGFKNRFYKSMFNLFNKVNFLIPATLYINVFTRLILRGKDRKKIIKKMKEYSTQLNKKTIKNWLEIMNKEYTMDIYKKIENKNMRIYLMGENDKVFIDSILKNVEEGENTKVVVLKNRGHLCHLEYMIDILKLTN